jgi:hypothetical protein
MANLIHSVLNHSREINCPQNNNIYVLISCHWLQRMILQFRSKGYIDVINRKIHDKPIMFIITKQTTILDHCRQWGNEEREKQKRKHKFDEDESLDSATFSIKPGEQDIGLFFFLKHQGTTSTLLDQLMHPRRVTSVLLDVGPPGFIKGD